MATFTAAQTGDWTASATWGNAGSPAVEGTDYPGAGDTAALAGYAVTWPPATTVLPAAGSLTAITASSTGYLTLTMSGTGQYFLNTAAITAGQNTTGIVRIGGGDAGAKTTVSLLNGVGKTTITGGTGTNYRGVYLNHASGRTVKFVCDVTGGGSGDMAYGITNDTTGSVTIGTVAEPCTITGGAGSSAFGCNNQSTGAIAIIGDVTGGSNSYYSFGLRNVSTGPVTITGNLIYGTKGPPIAGSNITWVNAGKYYQYGSVKFGAEPTAAQLLTGVVCGDVTGTIVLPDVIDVRDGMGYGAAGTEFGGSCGVPGPLEVIEGVAVDDTVGTYHAPEAAEVVSTAVFGPSSSISGTFTSHSPPVVWPPAGSYTTAQTILMGTSNSADTIYYTTDGSDPTSDSLLYSGPIIVGETVTVKAMAVASGVPDSTTTSIAYTISAAEARDAEGGEVDEATAEAFATLLETGGVSGQYLPAGGAPREINYIVIREQEGSVGLPHGAGPGFSVLVTNSSTLGIASEEVDCGGDSVLVAPRQFAPAQWRRVTKILYQDFAVLQLQVA